MHRHRDGPPNHAKSRQGVQVVRLVGVGRTLRLYGAGDQGYCYYMKFAWLLLLTSNSAADWMQEVRERGAALEAGRRWELAGKVYESALASASSPQDRFWLLTSLGEVSFERQDYAQARRWLLEAENAVQGLGENAPERARLLGASGTLYLVEGNLTAAERDLSRALAISESVATPPDLAAALHNLAAVDMQIGRPNEALIHETRALSIWRRQFGDRHYYVMKAWISLSSLQGICDDWRAAERSLRNALSIAETPEALANYAVVLERLKRGKEAREIRRRLHVQTPVPLPVTDLKAMPHEAERPQVRAQ